MRRNAVHCNNCDTTIESVHRHDYVRCACPDDDKSVAVDGGQAYSKRSVGIHADFTEVTDEFVPEPSHTLEHSDVVLQGVHHRSLCAGEQCTIHNMSNHSMRSWVQRWDPIYGMQRISPKSGHSYRDPDSLFLRGSK